MTPTRQQREKNNNRLSNHLPIRDIRSVLILIVLSCHQERIFLSPIVCFTSLSPSSFDVITNHHHNIRVASQELSIPCRWFLLNIFLFSCNGTFPPIDAFLYLIYSRSSSTTRSAQVFIMANQSASSSSNSKGAPANALQSSWDEEASVEAGIELDWNKTEPVNRFIISHSSLVCFPVLCSNPSNKSWDHWSTTRDLRRFRSSSTLG